ncbi:FAD-dependent monooxygenase [Krasilnikoviella flava]|uniref:2-polyprenyl-6-methoxyphenol hydroxylase n=1 Tax=Krasilnikoviella flava TaxID=526729 RepID=A0A1T5LYL3_9MICO|nr:FAD-dependent monooxygenase [Krasilnikoviella flava]SKC81071.1 2-polyprenyl-6-methoxyphenol hydroxylase [Krasilnikoviella flava]
MNKRILVVGASIAGLAVTHWLTRYGFDVTVVERAPAPRPGGNGVDVRGQAIEVVERMGLLGPVREAATDVEAMQFVDRAGRVTARISITEPGATEIMRGDLVALLRDQDGADYRFGHHVRGLRQDADGVAVEFERAPSERFALVVGADGMHSTVRRLACGPDERFVRFMGHYFAFADADATLGADRAVTMHNSPGKMAGLYRSGNHAQAKAYFIFRSAPLGHDHRDIEQHRRLLREAFADETGWRVPRLLEAALADTDLYFDALAQVRMGSWSNGRVVLVGDAAWCASPASGSGAELALVGAYRLAGELARAGGEHRTAFARYDAGQRSLVRSKQQIGPNVSLMVPRTTTGRSLRDALARLPILGPLGALERLLQGRARPLPTYAPADRELP